jgi:hypothetical protein
MIIDLKDRFIALIGKKTEKDVYYIFFMYMFRRFGVPNTNEIVLGTWIVKYRNCSIAVSFKEFGVIEILCLDYCNDISLFSEIAEGFIQSLLHSVDLQENSFNIFGKCTENVMPYFAPENIVENNAFVNQLLFRQSPYYFGSLLETALFGECRYNMPMYSVNENFVDKWHLATPTFFCYLFKRYGIDVNTITDYDICTFKIPTKMQGVYLRIIFKTIDCVHIDCIIDNEIVVKTDKERAQLNRLYKRNFRQFCIDNDLPIKLDCMNEADLIAAYESYLQTQDFARDAKITKAQNDKYSELFYEYYENKEKVSFEKFAVSENHVDRTGATKTVVKAMQVCELLINSFLDSIQVENSEINAIGWIDTPKFAMIVGDDLPHLNGLIYAVKDSDNEYYYVLTDIAYKANKAINENLHNAIVSPSAIRKDKCILITQTNKAYLMSLIERTLKLLAFILEVKESYLKIVKYW